MEQGTPRRRPDGKPFIPFVRFEDVVVKCGHVEKFGLMPDGKDRFRNDRRKKLMSRDCKECRGKRAATEAAALEARKAEKEQRKAHATEKSSARAVKRPQLKGRLPDGARFEVTFDAAKGQWSGTLTIPVPGGQPAVFTGSGSGLFPLLGRLDEQYRATLAAPAATDATS